MTLPLLSTAKFSTLFQCTEKSFYIINIMILLCTPFVHFHATLVLCICTCGTNTIKNLKMMLKNTIRTLLNTKIYNSSTKIRNYQTISNYCIIRLNQKLFRILQENFKSLSECGNGFIQTIGLSTHVIQVLDDKFNPMQIPVNDVKI